MKKHIKIAFIFLLVLVVISLITKYPGHTDVEEYVSVAKYFSGSYNADIRVSHNLLYGLINAPLIYIFKNIFIMKITNLFFLILIIISIYYISKKDKRVLFLVIASPIMWYLAPWISPIPLSAFLFLWAYYFIDKYDKQQKISSLIYSGLLLGLSIAFWNTAIFPAFFLMLCFFYGRNINHLLIFIFSLFVGYLPALFLDLIFYSFPFYSMIKYLMGIATVVLYGSIYDGVSRASFSLLPVIIFLIIMPLFSFTLFKKNFFIKNKKAIIFLILTFLFFLRNPQIRYILFFYPILILLLSKTLSKKQLKIQIVIFVIISLLVINPYLIQIKYSTNAKDFSSLISNFGKWKILQDENKIIIEDLKQIAKDYKNEIFVVGNNADDYAKLAYLYWDKDIKEFVSIQDYNFYLTNTSVLFEKTLKSSARIQDRRQIWISGRLVKSENDETNYEAISLGIGLGEPLNLSDFELIKKYKILYLSKKA